MSSRARTCISKRKLLMVLCRTKLSPIEIYIFLKVAKIWEKSVFGGLVKNAVFFGVSFLLARDLEGPFRGCPGRGYQGEKVVFA